MRYLRCFLLFFSLNLFGLDFSISTGFGLKYYLKYDNFYNKFKDSQNNYSRFLSSKIGMDIFFDFTFAEIILSYNRALSGNKVFLQDGSIDDSKYALISQNAYFKKDNLDFTLNLKYPIILGQTLYINPGLFLFFSIYMSGYQKPDDNWDSSYITTKLNGGIGLSLSFDINVTKIFYIRPFLNLGGSFLPEYSNNNKGIFSIFNAGLYFGFRFFRLRILN